MAIYHKMYNFFRKKIKRLNCFGSLNIQQLGGSVNSGSMQGIHGCVTAQAVHVYTKSVPPTMPPLNFPPPPTPPPSMGVGGVAGIIFGDWRALYYVMNICSINAPLSFLLHLHPQSHNQYYHHNHTTTTPITTQTPLWSHCSHCWYFSSTSNLRIFNVVMMSRIIVSTGH